MLYKTIFTTATAIALAGCATYGDDMSDTSMADTTASMNNTSAAVGVNIVQTVVDSPNHNTLESLVKTANLVDTLSGNGPFTVFAPTDAAFARIPAATRQALTEPSNREMLRGILTYHVVPGRLTSNDLAARIQAGNGTAVLTTVQGTQLRVTMEGDYVKITDATGNAAYVENANIRNSNGVIHSINGVLMPRN